VVTLIFSFFQPRADLGANEDKIAKLLQISRLDGEVAFNRIQRGINGLLCRIMNKVKEVNRDGREIKDSQIRILEENMEMINCSKQSVLKQILR